MIVRAYCGLEFLIDDEDFERVSMYRWHKLVTRKNIYLHARDENKKFVYLHRLLMSAPAGTIVDHANRNTLDNRRCNLRFATKSENVFNQGNTKSKSGHRGVHQDRHGGWYVRIERKGVRFHVGKIKTKEEAVQIYNRKAIELFGEFAFIDKIDTDMSEDDLYRERNK